MKSKYSLPILLLIFCAFAFTSGKSASSANSVSVSKADSSSVPSAVHKIMATSCFACHGEAGMGMALAHLKMAELGTLLAHVDGGVPNIRINIPQLNEYYLGQLIYFFEIACGISGYILNVNPFDQPGVEAYKKNMFALLEKPGFEKETAAIKARL